MEASPVIPKALDLFALCDKECKGFITRADMQRLHGELRMAPWQLEQVFDQLDEDGDGRLTLDEFAGGFEMFIGMQPDSEGDGPVSLSTGYESDDDTFTDLMSTLGAHNLFNEEDVIRRMWEYVKREDPELMNNFRHFLEHVTSELLTSKSENKSLESTLKSCKNDFDRQMQDLYEEMERQLQAETQQRISEEKLRAQKLKEALEVEINLKDEQITQLLEKQAQLETRLQEIQGLELETKKSNIVLEKERDLLECRLQATESMLTELRHLLHNVKRDDFREQRRQAEVNRQMTEGMVWERDTLVHQLQTLRRVNKRLLDEKDEISLLQQQLASLGGGDDVFVDGEQEDDEASPQQQDGRNRGSVMGNYFLPKRGNAELVTPINRLGESWSDGGSLSSADLCHESAIAPNHQKQLSGSDPHQMAASGPRDPERLFKVVFLGDSGVGKTSFIHRFCHNTFKSTFSATIGMDFRITSFNLDGHLVALQLWDTAGQERFRSITRQYYRKADAVMVVYDVTSEMSFKSVRNWIESVKEGAEEDVVIVLLGNKTDLCEGQHQRVVQRSDGQQLAEEYGAVFFEVSAKTAVGIQESIRAMCSLLQLHEDKRIERTLQLHCQAKKKTCCT